MPDVGVLLKKVNSRSHCQVPAPVGRQLTAVAGALRRILGGNLQGLWVHGSAATGGFNPRRSDLDLLGLTRRRVSVKAQRRIVGVLQKISGAPRPIEISLVSRADIVPWRHPTPFQFHWSEDHRERVRRECSNGSWRGWNRRRRKDADLAAHLAMSRTRGVTLVGPPPAGALPFVPVRDLIDSLVRDGRWALRLLGRDPGMAPYAVLNACRRLALLRRGFLLSKSEGAAWGLAELPARWRPVIAAALRGLPHPRSGSFLLAMARRGAGGDQAGEVRFAGD